MTDIAYRAFEKKQADRGIDLKAATEDLVQFRIETPSWGYGDSGTRFKVFRKTGVPRDPFEKFEDAAEVHRVTGICPSVALHIPWDIVDDFDRLRAHAESLGMEIGAINPNLFQDDIYMLGSITHHDESVRNKAVAHMFECIDIMRQTRSDILSLWFADGTNYPGQADIRSRKRWMTDALKQVYAEMDDGMRMLIEYKYYEPAFYHTDIADWGMSFNLAKTLGDNAQVLVDLGHHPLSANIAHIVAYLLDEKKIGGFHFNNRKYGDDDLIVGTINPYELFLIFHQIIAAKRDRDHGVAATANAIAYMIDQSHNIEPKIPAMIRSVLNCQVNYAKSLMINLDALKEKQLAGDVLGAEACVREAFEQDVEPFLKVVREEMGVPADPMAAFYASGYLDKIAARGSGGASW